MIRILDTKEAVDSLCRALKKLGIEYTVSHELLAHYHYLNLKYPQNAPYPMDLTSKVDCWIVRWHQEKEI